MTTTKGFSQRLSVAQFFVSAVIASLAIGAFAGVASAANINDSGLGVSVDVGANGNALVRGAEVTAVTDSEVKAETSWGSAVLNWVVKTDAETEYVGNNGKEMARGDIAVGDTISFRGTLDQTVSSLVVKAKVVKDWTKSVAAGVKLHGNVGSINSTLKSFVITDGSATTTVATNSSTRFEKNGDDASFADITLDSNVKVKGTWNASSTVLTATEVDIKSGSKKGWDKNDRKSWRNWIRSKVWLKVGKED